MYILIPGTRSIEVCGTHWTTEVMERATKERRRKAEMCVEAVVCGSGWVQSQFLVLSGNDAVSIDYGGRKSYQDVVLSRRNFEEYPFSMKTFLHVIFFLHFLH